MPETWLWLLPLLFTIGALYASVGQGGASAHLAALTLAGVSALAVRPAALLLNLIVAGMSCLRFARSGQIPWGMLGPLVACSAPFAVIGGAIDLPRWIHTKVVSLLLLWSAIKIFLRKPENTGPSRPPAARWKVYLSAAGIGLLAGLTGLGGGIFLAPLLIFAGWGTLHETMGLCAAFIVINSAAAILGLLGTGNKLPADMGVYVLAAGLGGWAGSTYGARLPRAALQKALAFILAAAALKMLLA
ncbi:MAG TPA: sulfite exporter TauE/SafE family protein [Methylomirabilota bacterium]|nr:sulfite exporter TauE/SafE family protein [Methylomirabilota bacterium]